MSLHGLIKAYAMQNIRVLICQKRKETGGYDKDLLANLTIRQK